MQQQPAGAGRGSMLLATLVLLLSAELCQSTASICRGTTDDTPGCVVVDLDSAGGLDHHITAAVAAAGVEGNCTNGWQAGPPSNKTLQPCICDPASFGCPTVDPAFNLTAVQFAGSFLSGMVLQRAPAQSAVFGTAPPGATVTIHASGPDGWSFSGDATAATASDAELHGTWKVLLPPRPAGRGYTIVAEGPAEAGGGTVTATLANVSFGDIWFCTGQSNMEDPVSQTFSRNDSFSAADAGTYDHIKLFQTRWRPRQNETWILPADGSSTAIAWEQASRRSLPGFSAACWYFGAELDKGINSDLSADEKVPIGLVASFVGGTFIEQWIPQRNISDCQQQMCGNPKGGLDGMQTINPQVCGSLYNGHIAPFVNLTITGAVWYQGENNVRNIAGSVSNHSGYACQQQLQIAEYRRMWSALPGTTDPLFPFGVTQLAGYSSEGFPWNSGAFRLAQTGGYGYMPNPAIPNSFLGQAFDLGDPWSKSCLHTKACFGWDTPYSFNRTCWYEVSYIHPRVKQPLGERLGRAALDLHYNMSALHTVPIVQACSLSGATLTIGFDPEKLTRDGDTLTVQPYNRSNPGSSALELLFKGAANWTFAQDIVALNATAISVALPAGADPAALSGVRYAWGDNPCCAPLEPAFTAGEVYCPPMGCPLLTEESKEPAVPFQVSVVGGACSVAPV